MRRGPVPRCPVTGLPMTPKSRDSLSKLPEKFLKDDGTFNAATLGDCNLFDIRSIAAAAGYRDVRYFIAKVFADPSSPFHAHPINCDETGRVMLYATHSNSADWGGREFRAKTLAVQTGVGDIGPLKLPPFRW